MIISASRRTDIPAFYSEWFMNRIKEKYVLIKNPFNAKQVKKIDLSPIYIEAIVFWTRNPKPLMKYLDELDDKGYNYYFQYTITGYPRTLEKFTPNPYKAIETFQELSEKIGKEKVIWRYDPIILTKFTPIEEHIRLFDKISSFLKDYTNKVIISFADPYKKLQNKLFEIRFENILENEDKFYKLIGAISEIAQSKNLIIETCSEAIDLEKFKIKHGKCIDDKLIEKLFNINLNLKKDKYQRKECGCIQSVDIGMYNTCSHGCQYCYATYSHKTVEKNKLLHNPKSPLLIGNLSDLDKEVLKKLKLNEKSLF